MDKPEALEKLLSGNKITHYLFGPKDFLYLSNNKENIFDEMDNFVMSIDNIFWTETYNKKFNKGWKIFEN